MKCIKVVKSKSRKRCLNKHSTARMTRDMALAVLCLLVWLISPKLKAQESGTFLRFQNQFPTALMVVIPDWLATLDTSKNTHHFSPIKAPAKWQSVMAPSPDRSPRVYNYHEIGIFCKLDVKLDKVSKLPIRFRLGTQEVVDRKEGKY